jgi:predicted membrane-bound mannosyltransferase
MKDKATTYLLCILVVAMAAGYFLLTYNHTLNPTDEGVLLYNFQKTAEGQVPHRDFYDVYGPGVYWVGGALFKTFGAKIMAIRIFLLIQKTVMALLIFLVARKALPAAFAFIAATLFILNWATHISPSSTSCTRAI